MFHTLGAKVMRTPFLLIGILGMLLSSGCAASVAVPALESMQELDYGGRERFVELDGERIAYVLEGSGARTLVFVHPWAGNLQIWDEVVRQLPEYRVLRLDLPGHGKSDKTRTRYEIDHAAQVVVGVMDHVGAGSVTLLGNSLGGAISMAVIRDHPDRLEALVLIDALGGGPVPGFFAFFIQQFFTAPLFSGADDGLVELFSDLFVFGANTTFNDRFMADLLASRDSAEGYAWSLAVSDYLRNATDYDATPWLGQITVPTLIVWGEDDWVIFPGAGDHLHESIPGSELVHFGDCGHMPEVDCPEQFVPVLRRFLAALP
ncbi:MAG: hypothetical protein AUK47_05835 [Deltaproteobacteria bacterium CG2_30_63_29]|nr:MAG: hypothetical protein AUK47_05835 [Deltaproteobacteria bacterium CG2_30_63_29]